MIAADDERAATSAPRSAQLTERFVEAGDLRMQVLEQGPASDAPLVVLLHGFPELPIMWRRVMAALASAGFRSVAPAQRGYGRTEGMADVAHCTTPQLVGDVVALVRALLGEDARRHGATRGPGPARHVIVGHDWGALVAWQCALMRPDLFRAVVGISTPYTPRSDVFPTARIRAMVGDKHFYALHFQAPGVAEAEIAGAGVASAFRRILYGASGDAPEGSRFRPSGPRGMALLEGTEDPAELPAWLGEDVVEACAAEFGRRGFEGPLNWYRAMDLSWALTTAYAGAVIQVPALFLYGDADPIVPHVRRAIAHLPRQVADLRETLALPGIGHWPHMEAPHAVSAAIVRFVRSLA